MGSCPASFPFWPWQVKFPFLNACSFFITSVTSTPSCMPCPAVLLLSSFLSINRYAGWYNVPPYGPTSTHLYLYLLSAAALSLSIRYVSHASTSSSSEISGFVFRDKSFLRRKKKEERRIHLMNACGRNDRHAFKTYILQHSYQVSYHVVHHILGILP